MTSELPDQDAIDIGRDSAERLLHPPKSKDAPLPKKEPGLLLAVGDSWFNYWPRGDVLDVLEDQLGHQIERNAVAGRTLEQMLYKSPPASSGRALADGEAITWLTRRIARLSSEDGSRLQAVLVSAGGNDVAGDREVLKRLINQIDMETTLNTEGVEELVNGKLRRLYVTMLSCINDVCRRKFKHVPPILLHGYAHPIPDGRGILGNPWLGPALRDLGYDSKSGARVMALLIDALNNMQKAMVADLGSEFANVRHVDVRVAFNANDPYKLFWQNELHPTIPVGFGAVARCFIQTLSKPPGSPAVAPAPGASA